MNFSPYPWDLLPFGGGAAVARLEQPRGDFTDVLLNDAIACGIEPDKQPALGGFIRLDRSQWDEPNCDIVMVGLDNTKIPEPTNGYTGFKFGFEFPALRERRVIGPIYHIALRVVDNPLELQWKWNPIKGARIAILNLEQATSMAQIKEIWKKVEWLHQQIRPRSGGPKGATLEEQINAVTTWREAQGKELKVMVADRFGVSERQLSRWENNLVRMGRLSPRAKQ